MNIFKKLNLILTKKNDEYSEYVDKLINNFIDNGHIIGYNNYEIIILYKNKQYNVWAANYPYADLSKVTVEKNEKSNMFNECIYDNLRPSRKTQIRFWEWCEKHGIEPNHIGNINCKFL